MAGKMVRFARAAHTQLKSNGGERMRDAWGKVNENRVQKLVDVKTCSLRQVAKKCVERKERPEVAEKLLACANQMCH